jgi:hypothetical protein
LARVLVVLVLSGLLSMTVTVASGVGTDDDPLVTLSYLKETFTKDILKQVDEKIAARNKQIAQQVGDQTGSGEQVASEFTVVTLSNGQTLIGDIGCEVLLRVGTAACVSPSAPGLIDESNAAVLNNGGALSQNHLYMMTIEGRGVKATANTTKLMVRGSYTIN